MGRLCELCGDQMGGGVVPKSCSCPTGFCFGCWNSMFTPKYNEVKETYYVKQGDTYVPVEKPIFEAIPVIPRCNWCKKKYKNIEGPKGWKRYG